MCVKHQLSYIRKKQESIGSENKVTHLLCFSHTPRFSIPNSANETSREFNPHFSIRTERKLYCGPSKKSGRTVFHRADVM